ncbi:acetate--CoA ligase family protein, partial [Lutibacter sp.]|uniref:acetate--CoA ligase family protein n=1 Tax=Lutibacter sp. TaxID=1925666 RepID=UPI00349FDD1E
TAEQLATIINYCEHKFDEIDAMVVIFGSPGLFEVYNVYDVLHKKMRDCKKPIFPILPSVVNVKKEIDYFVSKGNINFTDEVLFGNALGKVLNTTKPKTIKEKTTPTNSEKIRAIIDIAKNGYLQPQQVKELLLAAEVPIVNEAVCSSKKDCLNTVKEFGFPVVMKVVGPIHKSDVGGIILNITSEEKLIASFDTIMKIDGATSVLIQPMKKGIELFIGAKKETNFGHLVLCGLGGIYIEVLKDIQAGLAPISNNEAVEMIHNLKSYKIIQGVRNQKGINETKFAEIIEKISNLVTIAPEISELDLNPLLGNSEEIFAVDARIRICK